MAAIAAWHSTSADLGLYERHDIQRLLRDAISALGEDLLVVAEEFGHWEDARRRIDLLAIDRTGHLVVIEPKRDESGGHMELQAIRYAAMVSSMGFAEVAAAYAALTEHRNEKLALSPPVPDGGWCGFGSVAVLARVRGSDGSLPCESCPSSSCRTRRRPASAATTVRRRGASWSGPSSSTMRTGHWWGADVATRTVSASRCS
jgi:hypothetical protein